MQEKKKFRIKNLFKNSIFTFILGIFLTSVIGASAATLLYSKDVIYDNSISGLNSTNLQDALDELYEQTSSIGGCPTSYTVYAFNTNSVTIGTSTLTDLGTSYATLSEAAASNMNSDGVLAIKYIVENNVLTEGYSCLLKDSEEYCLKGNDTNAFKDNVAILNIAFPDCGASTSLSHAGCISYGKGANVNSNGTVYWYSRSTDRRCIVTDYGGASCSY